MIDFRFMYEHKPREMESIALVCQELKKRGYTFDFFPCNGQGGKPKAEAKVVITPYLYDDMHIAGIKRYIKNTKKIVNFQWEQVFKLKYEGDPMYFHYPKNSAKKAVHLCWGDREKFALQKCGIAEERCAVVGPVHMDLLRPEFIGYYFNKHELAKKYHISDEKEWILFISSFSGEARKLDANGNPIDETDADRSKTIFISWVKKMLISMSDKVFVYRPHPNEKSDLRLKKLEEEYDNFYLISDLSVKQWILASDKIITWISTSTAEVYFANKSCIIVRPVYIEKSEDMAILADARNVEKYETLIDELNKLANEFPVSDEIMKAYYDYTNVPSYIRICNLLEEVYHNDKYNEDYCVKVKSSLFFVIKKLFANSIFYKTYIDIFASIDGMLYKILPYKIRVLVENSKMRKKDYITDDEMEEAIRKMELLQCQIKE